MTGYLLDTNVISEYSRKKCDERLRKWVDAQGEDTLHLSVLTLGEIRKGTALLPEGKRRTELEAWLANELPARFNERLLPVSGKIAELWGEMTAEAQLKGTPAPVIDSLLAATARHHDLTVATRNVKDFTACGVPVINPWDFQA